MPSFFSKLRRGRQQAKEHSAKRAQKANEEQAQPAPAPYKHVPKHAGIDAMSGAPSTWNHSDYGVRVQEANRRRSMGSIPARSATGTIPRVAFSPPSPSVGPRYIHGAPNHQASNSSLKSLPQRKSWQERKVVMSYSSEDLSISDTEKKKGQEATTANFTFSGVSTPRSRVARARSFVMPSTDETQHNIFGSAGTRNSVASRSRPPRPTVADIWYHDPTAPPVPSIPAEFTTKTKTPINAPINAPKNAPKITRSFVHTTASSVSSNASDTSSSSSSGPSTPSTIMTTPRSSIEKPPALLRPATSNRKQILVRMPSSELMKPKTARFSDIKTPVVSYQPKRDSTSSLRNSRCADVRIPSHTKPNTMQAALQPHAISGLTDLIDPVSPPETKTKARRRFSMWAYKQPTVAAT